MEKKLINEELLRISEIMNVSPKLIVEGGGWTEFLEKIGIKSGSKEESKIIERIKAGEIVGLEATKAVEAFEALLEKDVLSQTERQFVTKVIDELFPNFVDRENDKIYNLINQTNNLNIQDTLLASIIDVKKTDEIVAAQLEKALGIEVSPESVRLIRNREPEFYGNIEIPKVLKSKKDNLNVDNFDSKPLNPTKKPKIKDNELDDDVIETVRNRYLKSNPKEFSDFETKIQTLTGLSNKSKQRLYADFEHYWDYSTTELQRELDVIKKQMTKSQFAAFTNILAPFGIKNWTFGGIISKSLLIVGISIGYKLIKCTNSLMACIAEIMNMPEDYEKAKEQLKQDNSNNGTTPDNGGSGNTPETITTEAQLRAKYPCVNREAGVRFSPITNNKCTVTFSNGDSYELTINGDKVTYTQDGSEICVN